MFGSVYWIEGLFLCGILATNRLFSPFNTFGFQLVLSFSGASVVKAVFL